MANNFRSFAEVLDWGTATAEHLFLSQGYRKFVGSGVAPYILNVGGEAS